LLQSKPETVKKALSENSLLKNINFYETFLGEENLTEGKISYIYILYIYIYIYIENVFKEVFANVLKIIK